MTVAKAQWKGWPDIDKCSACLFISAMKSRSLSSVINTVKPMHF